jgi:polar amino acid transport system permease protein
MNDLILFVQNILPDFLNGLVVTIQLTIVGLSIGFVLGIPTAFAKVYGKPWMRRVANGYTDLFRGTPLLVQLFLVYYGLPDFNITLSRLTAAFVAMGLNSGAYQAEYLRGAIQTIGSGQMMAARSIGMSRLKAIRHIILPQALRIVIPPWSNEPISLLKASAVAFLIAVPDLMTKAKTIVARTYDPIPTYMAVAVFYMLLVMVLTTGLNVVEKRIRIPGMQIDVANRK